LFGGKKRQRGAKLKGWKPPRHLLFVGCGSGTRGKIYKGVGGGRVQKERRAAHLPSRKPVGGTARDTDPYLSRSHKRKTVY